MSINLDSTIVTISCPKCGKQLKEKIGRLKRDNHIVCPVCGRMAVSTDQIRKFESASGKQLTDQLAKLNKTINIKL